MNFFSIKKRKEALFTSYVPEQTSLDYLKKELNKEISQIKRIHDSSSHKNYLKTLYRQAERFQDRMQHSWSFSYEEKEEWLLISITTLRLARQLHEPFIETQPSKQTCIESLSLLNTPNDYYETKIAQLTFSVIALVSVGIIMPAMGFPPLLAVCFGITLAAAWIASIYDLQKQSNQSYEIVKPITEAALEYGEEALSLEKEPSTNSYVVAIR